MTIMEWIWLAVIAVGGLVYLQYRFANSDFHGAALARYGMTRIGMWVAGVGIVGFVFAWLI